MRGSGQFYGRLSGPISSDHETIRCFSDVIDITRMTHVSLQVHFSQWNQQTTAITLKIIVHVYWSQTGLRSGSPCWLTGQTQILDVSSIVMQYVAAILLLKRLICQNVILVSMVFVEKHSSLFHFSCWQLWLWDSGVDKRWMDRRGEQWKMGREWKKEELIEWEKSTANGRERIEENMKRGAGIEWGIEKRNGTEKHNLETKWNVDAICSRVRDVGG